MRTCGPDFDGRLRRGYLHKIEHTGQNKSAHPSKIIAKAGFAVLTRESFDYEKLMTNKNVIKTPLYV
ncbi:MAG: hypothetical protein D3925_03700 [Candidatus Electrothrix sp. AR5]|nr:hypothetical protein [Candidatus Electrothrix sp. AR5]